MIITIIFFFTIMRLERPSKETNARRVHIILAKPKGTTQSKNMSKQQEWLASLASMFTTNVMVLGNCLVQKCSNCGEEIATQATGIIEILQRSGRTKALLKGRSSNSIKM